jgi:hypothetical protein
MSSFSRATSVELMRFRLHYFSTLLAALLCRLDSGEWVRPVATWMGRVGSPLMNRAWYR